MTSIGFKTTLFNLQFLTVAALTIWLLAVANDQATPLILGSCAAGLLLLSGLTYRSRTIVGWIWHRLTYRRARPVNIRLYRHKQTGVTWDGRKAAAYIEILPDPYEVTVVNGNEFTPQRTIPIDEIRDELTQFDIHTHHTTIFTIGHKYDRKTSLSALAHSAIGPVDALLYGRTIIEVSVELAGSIDSVAARKGTGSDADGLNNTVTIAAERIRRRISAVGRPARLLTDTDLKSLDTALRNTLVPALLDQHWSCAGRRTMQAMSYTPESTAWTPEHYRQWCRLGEHRQIHAVRLTSGTIGDRAEMYATMISTDPTALNTNPPAGLRLEYGQQRSVLTGYVPSVRTVDPSAIPGKTLLHDQRFPIPLIPSGIGTYLGHTKNRSRVFVNFTTGAAPFYLIAPARLCQQLLMRLATSGRTIDIDSDDERWTRFAKRIGATSGTKPDADIVFTNNHAPVQQGPTQVRLVWATSPNNVPRHPDYAIVAHPDECQLYTPDGVTRYIWSTTSAEEPFFTFPKGAASAGPSRSAPASVPPLPPPPLPPPPKLPKGTRGAIARLTTKATATTTGRHAQESRSTSTPELREHTPDTLTDSQGSILAPGTETSSATKKRGTRATHNA